MKRKNAVELRGVEPLSVGNMAKLMLLPSPSLRLARSHLPRVSDVERALPCAVSSPLYLGCGRLRPWRRELKLNSKMKKHGVLPAGLEPATC